MAEKWEEAAPASPPTLLKAEFLIAHPKHSLLVITSSSKLKCFHSSSLTKMGRNWTSLADSFILLELWEPKLWCTMHVWAVINTPFGYNFWISQLGKVKLHSKYAHQVHWGSFGYKSLQGIPSPRQSINNNSINSTNKGQTVCNGPLDSIPLGLMAMMMGNITALYLYKSIRQHSIIEALYPSTGNLGQLSTTGHFSDSPRDSNIGLIRYGCVCDMGQQDVQ